MIAWERQRPTPTCSLFSAGCACAPQQTKNAEHNTTLGATHERKDEGARIRSLSHPRCDIVAFGFILRL